MYPELEKYIQSTLEEVQRISSERESILTDLVNYVKQSSNVKLNFICTHNSRRSHLSQVWAQVAANYFGVNVSTFSGGTEATAFNVNAVEALRGAGFQIANPGGENPRYEVSFSEDESPMICYSKTFDDEINPKEEFAAIMTCSEADAECPIVFGADVRIKLFYEDPKVSDGTTEQTAVYSERCKQIATEMIYVFSQIK